MKETTNECTEEQDQTEANNDTAIEMVDRGNDYADYEIKDLESGDVVTHTRVVFLAD